MRSGAREPRSSQDCFRRGGRAEIIVATARVPGCFARGLQGAVVGLVSRERLATPEPPHDRDPAARAKHATHLPQDMEPVGDQLQHERAGDDVERGIRKREAIARRPVIPDPPAHGGRQVGSLPLRDRQHPRRHIDRVDAELTPAPHGGRHERSRPAADIEHGPRAGVQVGRQDVEQPQGGRVMHRGPPGRVALGDPVVARFLVRHPRIVPCRIRELRPPRAVRGPLAMRRTPVDALVVDTGRDTRCRLRTA